MSHYLYLDHVIQNDNCDLYSTQYIFNLVSHYFYSAHDTNKVVSQYIYSAHRKVHLSKLVVAFHPVIDNWRTKQNNLKLFSPFWCLNQACFLAIFLACSEQKNAEFLSFWLEF